MDQGIIVRAVSGFYYVKTEGEEVECSARGRFRLEKITPLVGDHVKILPTGGGKGALTEILPRKNSFIRPAVANLDQLVIVASAALPVTDPFLIDRVTALAEMKDCDAVICVNKHDLDPGDTLFSIYRDAGYQTVRTSIVTGEGVETLRSMLSGKISVFTGNSGVGKSSILNALAPGFSLKVGEVSRKLGRGRHTTRHVELFTLPGGAVVADTPGFSSFDMDWRELADETKLQFCFREFAPYIGACRYQNCAHVKEQGCAVLEALSRGEIHPSRHESYVRLYRQAREIHPWEIK